MSLASTSSVQISYLEETTFGVIETGTPKNLRMTGESLAYDISSEASKEINASRQVSDLVQVGATAQGGINFEAQYREYDPFFEALLSSTFDEIGTDGVSAVTVDFTVSGNNVTASVGDFTGIVAGQWISFIGAGDNSGIYRVDTVNSVTDLDLDSDYPISSDATTVACDVSSSRLTLGLDALRTFTIQKEFSDVAQFFAYRGMAASKLSLNLATGALLTGSLDFMGSDSVRDSVTQFSGAANAASGFGIMNAVTGVGKILLDGAPLAGTFVKSATVDINGNLRGQTAIGTLGNVGIGTGTFDIGGTLEFYLNDGAIYDQALANTSVSIEFPISDVLGNGYAFIFNNCKLGVPTVQAGSKDADVMLSVPFTAIAPSNADRMVYIDRFGAAS